MFPRELNSVSATGLQNRFSWSSSSSKSERINLPSMCEISSKDSSESDTFSMTIALLDRTFSNPKDIFCMISLPCSANNISFRCLISRSISSCSSCLMVFSISSDVKVLGGIGITRSSRTVSDIFWLRVHERALSFACPLEECLLLLFRSFARFK